MKKMLEINDLKILAKKKLPKMFYDYVDSGSYTESTYLENETDFNKINDNYSEDLEWWQKLVWYKELSYILKTGNNWNGPIKKFRLEITRSPPFFLQTCFKGLKRVSESKYVFEAENYEPSENLNITFHF